MKDKSKYWEEQTHYWMNAFATVCIIAFVLFILTIVLFVKSCSADEIDNITPYVIIVESSGNPKAVSPKGAVGLMQITPIVLKEFNDFYKNQHTTFDELWNKKTNIAVGSWYLRRIWYLYLPKEYRTIENLCAAYNGGITRLRNNNYDWTKMPQETVKYVKKIKRLMSK